ncbi:MAG: hypothetical protein LBE22_09240 [Azoarcus sp.]|jgi:hypothetical protein|nr:hypothetical protein [Azoarcus sp.]
MTANLTLKIARCPASSGFKWLIAPFKIFAKHPFRWFLVGLNILLIYSTFFLFCFVVDMVFDQHSLIWVIAKIMFPYIVTAIAIALIPSILSGIALLGVVQERNVKPRVSQFWKGFNFRFSTLFVIGLIPAVILTPMYDFIYGCMLNLYMLTTINTELSLLILGVDINTYLNYVLFLLCPILLVVLLHLSIFYLPTMIAAFQRNNLFLAVINAFKAYFANFKPVLVFVFGLLIIGAIYLKGMLGLSLFVGMEKIVYVGMSSSASLLDRWHLIYGQHLIYVCILCLSLSFCICWFGLSAYTAYREIFHGRDKTTNQFRQEREQ